MAKTSSGISEDLLFQASFTITQGGADTSAEATLPTGLLPGVDLAAWELVGAEVQFTTGLGAWAAADSFLSVQVTKRGLAGAITALTYADADLVTVASWVKMADGTPASALLVPASYWWDFPAGAIIYSTALYIQLISTATALTNTVFGRIFYRPVTLTQSEALAVIAARP